MQIYKADLHIHTVLSPCGSLEMSPVKIVETAKQKGLNIIGIADHNSTLHCKLTRQIAEKEGIFVLQGAEVTTREEVHCLTFFENDDQLSVFQHFLEERLITIPNDPARFGYQVVVDMHENIIWEVENLLIAAINCSISELEKKVHSLNGIFIPAHIDRPSNSLMSQLGFMPADLQVDAIEVTGTSLQMLQSIMGQHASVTVLKNSDAHYPEHIGQRFSRFEMEECSFAEIRKAMLAQDSRKVVTP